MPNSNYNRGRAYEYRAKKELEAQGYSVIRAAGSHGPFDLIAVPRTPGWLVRCVQIKVTKVESSIPLLVRKFTEGLQSAQNADVSVRGPAAGSTMSENGAQATFVSELWVWHRAKWHKFASSPPEAVEPAS